MKSMAYLEHFSADERALLTALPYRAGLWISQADGKGGDKASAAELQALDRVIAGQTRGMHGSAFVHEVMADVMAQRGAWVGWGDRLTDVPVECGEAARLVNAKLTRHDLDAYRATIMRIGTGVAKAFQGRNAFKTPFKMAWGFLAAPFRNEPFDRAAIVNISRAEENALNMLARHLSAGADRAVDDTDIPDR